MIPLGNEQNIDVEDSSSFDFNRYAVPPEDVVEDPEVVGEVQEFTTQDQDPFNFDIYSVDKEKSGLQEVGRHAARTASRVGETLVGFPGDIVQLVEWVSNKLPDGPKILSRNPNLVQKMGQNLVKRLPTSGDLKNQMSKITSGFVDPQNAQEEFGDDVAELASMLVGDKSKAATKLGKAGKSFLKSIGKATGAKLASKTAESLGADEVGQFFSEMGTLGLMSILNQKMASKYVSDKFTKARNLLPEGTMVDTGRMSSRLEKLESELSKGLSTNSKNEVKQAVSEIKAKVSSGLHPANEVVDFMHDINERMGSKKLFDELSKTEQKKLRFRYNDLKDVVGKEISEIGKGNPEFLRLWSEGMEGFASIENSKKATRFLEKRIGKLPDKVAQGMAIELFLGHPEFAAATAGTFTALKSGELINRISKSPSLRKHYLEVLTAAADENISGTLKALNQLEDGLHRSFKDQNKK